MLPLFLCRTTAIPAVARCKPTPMQQLWRMMMLIQQLLLPVVSKKLKDSLPNSFFACSSAKAHICNIQDLFCCNNVTFCSLKLRLTLGSRLVFLYMRFIYCGISSAVKYWKRGSKRRRVKGHHWCAPFRTIVMAEPEDSVPWEVRLLQTYCDTEADLDAVSMSMCKIRS